MADLLLGVDVGTYSTKGVIVDRQGRVLHAATASHTVDFPRPGWAEQHPDSVWWSGLCSVTRQLLGGDIGGSQLAAVGVSAIGPCMVPLDTSGEALRPGILYGVDTRARDQIKELEGRIGRNQILEWSRMELSSQAVGPKIAWYRQNEPELWGRTAHIVTASSYLIWRLTRRLVIDHHQAAHFIPLYDRQNQVWSNSYADGICPVDMLPDLGWCDEAAGEVTAVASEETGIPEGTPVVVGGVDALSEAVSVGAVAPGDLMVMYGSTAFFILSVTEPVSQPPLWSLPGAFPGTHLIAAGMATTGSLTRWLADLVSTENGGVELVYSRLFSEAASVPAGSAGLLMLPYFSGERTPINDPKARGVVAGLSLAHGRAHLFRAALEGVAFGIRHNLETMDSDHGRIQRLVAVGGGTQSDLWIQIVSDVTGRTQHLPAQTIGASYGDAYLAGLGAGVLAVDDLQTWVHYQRRIDPQPADRARYDSRYQDFKELYDATRTLVHRLGAT